MPDPRDNSENVPAGAGMRRPYIGCKTEMSYLLAAIAWGHNNQDLILTVRARLNCTDTSAWGDPSGVILDDAPASPGDWECASAVGDIDNTFNVPAGAAIRGTPFGCKAALSYAIADLAVGHNNPDRVLDLRARLNCTKTNKWGDPEAVITLDAPSGVFACADPAASSSSGSSGSSGPSVGSSGASSASGSVSGSSSASSSGSASASSSGSSSGPSAGSSTPSGQSSASSSGSASASSSGSSGGPSAGSSNPSQASSSSASL